MNHSSPSRALGTMNFVPKRELFALFSGSPVRRTVSKDLKENLSHLFHFLKHHYVLFQAVNELIRYASLIAVHAGASPKVAKKKMKEVVEFEYKLAKVRTTRI